MTRFVTTFLQHSPKLYLFVHADKYLHKWIKRKFQKKEQCDQPSDENRNAQPADRKAATADVEAHTQQSDQSKKRGSSRSSFEIPTSETMKKIPTDAFGDISFIPKVNKSGNTSKVGKFLAKIIANNSLYCFVIQTW